LLPRQRKEHGLKAGDLEIPESVLQTIIQGYTEEAGVRTLERQLAAICRNRVVTLAERDGEDTSDIGPDFVIDDQYVEQVLGQAHYNIGIDGRIGVPGVALGLAWTQVGGKVMVVEASRVPTIHGGGKLKLTGQIGSVMTESAELALSWIRTHASQLSQDKYLLPQGEDLHIHFPAGAVEKDGPSAGVTITTSLVSLLTDRVVQPHLAMTGEISLHGLVLPVGGVKDKLLAAHR